MMQTIINRIRTTLDSTLNQLLGWVSTDAHMLDYIPDYKGWSVRQVLEHISLTNHFLLILIKKGAAKAIAKAQEEQPIHLPDNYDLEWDKMAAIGQHGAFEWNRPLHMEPTGLLSLEEIAQTLQNQFDACTNLLHQLQGGEGVLYKTQMSVHGLGKIDVYHYIYFLVLHAQRHVQQMQQIQEAYKRKQSCI